MTIPFATAGASASGVEALVYQMVETATDTRMIKIQDLWARLHDLRRDPVVEKDPETLTLIQKTIDLIDYRNPEEHLPIQEHRFYNYSLELIDRRKEKIDPFSLDKLRKIVFREPEAVDAFFDTYRTAVVQRETFERELRKMRLEMTALSEKLKRYTTMTPTGKILLGKENKTYQIPSEIVPIEATHIFLYVYVGTGGTSIDPGQHEAVIANSLGHQHHLYFYLCGNQSGVSYNSNQFWLEICPRREITLSGFYPSFTMGCYIIGFK